MAEEDSLQQFTFKPALLAGPRTVKLTDAGLELWEKDEKVDEIAYSRITGLRHIENRVQRNRFFQFHVARGDDKPLYLTVNTTSFATPANDPDVQALYQMAEALTARLVDAGSVTDVEIGYGKLGRWAWFGLGAACIIFSIGIFVLALNTGVREEKLWGAAFPMGLLALIGAFVCAGSNPFAPPVRLPLAAFSEYLSARLELDSKED